MEKRTILKITAAFLSALFIFPQVAFALESDFSVSSKSAVLVEGTGGKILFEKNKDEKTAPASITKIMTMLLVCEALDEGNISLDDKVTVSLNAQNMGGSQIWLKENETMTVDELLKAAAIASANDASVALAEFIAGSEEAFVSMMNKRGEELGLKDTLFQNCTGLDEENHYTTAGDISIVAMEILKHPIIKKYSTVWMDELRGGKTSLVNTNKLIRFYKGATGLKTGTTDNAGCCLCATAERDNLPLIAVTLGNNTSEERFKTARELLNYGFANYKAVKVPSLDKELDPVRVKRGERRYAGIKCDMPSYVVTERRKKAPLKIKALREKELYAPACENTPAGTIKIMQGDELLSEIPLKTAWPVEKLTYNAALNRVFKNVFSL